MQLAYLVDKNNEGPVDESESRCCPSNVCSLVSLMHHTTSIDRMHSCDKELIKMHTPHQGLGRVDVRNTIKMFIAASLYSRLMQHNAGFPLTQYTRTKLVTAGPTTCTTCVSRM
jgi:hypothetical protein